ncbi:hypothetical protein [Actinopolyspora mortivallis]|uniref:Uncharacterized protein n=1 Tax=Actinopolyspora mortivallis TaxID=33906 RepID=A0A2T0GXP7_ACTMO|nr:hypothetical protein [Actinopolyspora mortivallis]PRW63867.1 hypothetical protein CEP50_07760 [Actinopolyspora mortivallis]
MATPRSPLSGTPPALRAGLGLWGAVGVFLLVRALLSWLDFGTLRDRVTQVRDLPAGRAAAMVRDLLLVNTALAVVLAAGYLVLAWLVLRRRSWARIALTVLAAVHVLSVLAFGAWTASNLIVFVLVVLAWACFWRRSTSEWLSGERG